MVSPDILVMPIPLSHVCIVVRGITMPPLAGKITVDVFDMTTSMSGKEQIMRQGHTCGVFSCHHRHFPLPNLPYDTSQPDGMCI